jgi:SOS response regulatory protein OraA/RecX
MAQIDAEDEASAAEQIASKKLAQTAALPKEVRLRRAVAQLTRKGYSPGIALSTVKRLLAEEPST